MSEKDAVRDTKTDPDHDSDPRDDGAVVDIGIAVDVSTADGPDPAPSADVGFEFEEDDLLEAADADRRFDAIPDDGIGASIEPDERDALEAAEIDPEAVVEKEHSYRSLLGDGVDEQIADTLRRRYSLPWSFESDGDLDRRSSVVRGLGAAEREWIAVSEDDDWQSFEYDHTGPISTERERPSERPYPRPTPTGAVTGVGPDDADALAEAGIRSAERLATIDAMTVATHLELDVLHVRMWRHNARELLNRS
ncbi:hypothetical protein [Natrinema caseinilyticum]|uniref:hypothetical protein n=1 Tax=Natrinema caseinilyticum TaxID=2961570 RepID=UPI0020C28C97|nr:hypothetical protein [Natrinema caseinilyticum]